MKNDAFVQMVSLINIIFPDNLVHITSLTNRDGSSNLFITIKHDNKMKAWNRWHEFKPRATDWLLARDAEANELLSYELYNRINLFTIDLDFRPTS